MRREDGDDGRPIDLQREERHRKWAAMFEALNAAIERACDEDVANDISDAYRHLTGDCIPEACVLCGDEVQS